MTLMNRRTFLFSSAVGGVGGLGLAGASGWTLFSTGPEDVVVRVVRDHFPDARIARDELYAFARDFLVQDRTSRTKLLALRATLPIMRSGTLSRLTPARVQELYQAFERRIVTRFILSTDFLQRGPDGDGPVTYRAIADPYLLGCANPLARFDLEGV